MFSAKYIFGIYTIYIIKNVRVMAYKKKLIYFDAWKIYIISNIIILYDVILYEENWNLENEKYEMYGNLYMYAYIHMYIHAYIHLSYTQYIHIDSIYINCHILFIFYTKVLSKRILSHTM